MILNPISATKRTQLPIRVIEFFLFGCREEMGFEPQGLWPFEPGLWRFINSKLHLSQSQRQLPKLCSTPMRHKRRGLCPPPQWRHTASFGVSARQIADNLETNFQKSGAPTAIFTPSGKEHFPTTTQQLVLFR